MNQPMKRPEEVKAKPFLKWAGSKRKLLPELREYWTPNYHRYIEPFAGSASLFFELRPNDAILGDLNKDLIDTYAVVRSRPRELHEALTRLPNNPTTYYRVRSVVLNGRHSLKRAARFIYLNRFCFNGLYRTNSSGVFNVPYGGRKSGAVPSVEAFLRASQQLRQANLIAGDFGKILSLTRPGDFVYLDPPFRVASRRVFNEYDKAAFSTGDLARLRSWMLVLETRKVKFVVSYAESREARYLAEGFQTDRVRVRRNIAGFAGKRRLASELLISN